MANTNLLHHVIFMIIITTTTTTTAQLQQPFLSPLTSLTQILTTLGYTDLATASHSLSLSSDLHLPWFNPITVFAATDTSLRSCHSCSLPLLLKQHTLSALYPFNYLQNLIFGTKIETLHVGHCLTVTSTAATTTVFINGVEITHPNLYVSNTVIVHGIQGFISHLSPYSCLVESLTTLLSLKSPRREPPCALTPMMITDAMIRLRTSGLSVLALALRVKFAELSNLHNMTLFSVNDESIFHDGNSYVHNLKYHIIPNRVLKLVDLENLASGTTLPTLEIGEFLTVTTAGSGDILSPMRINYVKITRPNFIYNTKLVVHGISNPFVHIQRSSSGNSGTSGGVFSEFGLSDVSRSSDGNVRLRDDAPSPVMESTDEIDYDRQGL